MRVNHARKRLLAGEPSIGTWLALPSPEAAEYMGRLDFDWLVVDAEHSAVDIRTLGLMFSCIAAGGTAPMVRIPWNTPENIKRVLDAGAWGIVVPMVNSRSEAEAAVEAARYAPEGNRSVGGSRHALSFGTAGSTYYQNANNNILVVLQIEHIDGVENAEEILCVPGVDACFIGPNDLGASMGIGLGVPLESDHPEMIKAIEHVRTVAQANNVAPGIHCSSAAAVNRRIDEGFRFCAMASELRYMLAALNSGISELNWAPSDRQNIASESHGADTVRY